MINQRNKNLIISILIILVINLYSERCYSEALFRSPDLTQVESLYPSNIKPLLKDTNLSGLEFVFLKAQSEYNINVIFLISLAALESGWGTSDMAINKNNLFGFCAYDNSTNKAKTFESKSDCIMCVAKYISENYLTESGKYYNGTTLEDINIKYSSDKEWSNKVANIMDSQYKKLNKQRITANRSIINRHKCNKHSKFKMLRY